MMDIQKQRLHGLTQEEMMVHDSQKSLQKAKALLKQIDTDAMNQTYNFIISKVQEKSNSDMSNLSLIHI